MSLEEDYAICEAAHQAENAIDIETWESEPRQYSDLPRAIQIHCAHFGPVHVEELLDRIRELEAQMRAIQDAFGCWDGEEQADTETLVEWIKEGRQAQIDLQQFTYCPMCEDGYPMGHGCKTWPEIEAAKLAKAEVRIRELEDELAGMKSAIGGTDDE